MLRKNPRFSQHLKSDLERTFFSENEFTETALIAGKRVRGDLVKDTLGSTSIFTEPDLRNANLARGNWIFYCMQSEVGPDYKKIQRIRINNADYTVLQVSDEMGVLAFTLSRISPNGGRR